MRGEGVGSMPMDCGVGADVPETNPDSASPDSAGQPAPVRSDGWFREIAEQTGDVFYAIRTDPDFAIEFVSDSVSRWGDYSATDYIAGPGLLGWILDPRDRERVSSAFGIEPGRNVEVEFR